MKLSLREKMWVTRGVLILGLLMLFAIPVSLWFLLLATVCVIGGAIFSSTQIRCPHCGKWLGRELGEYCIHCGTMIDYDAK